MISQQDIRTTARLVSALPRVHFDTEEFMYGHVSQCILAAVYSIGARAESERNVVRRYTQWADLAPALRPSRTEHLPVAQQEPVDWFKAHIEREGMETFTTTILQNSQLTSTINGMPKAQAVYLFARTCLAFNVYYMQDALAMTHVDAFERRIRQIQGQGSGVSYDYFCMLVGDEDRVKADRHVVNFLTQAVGRPLSREDVLTLLTEVASHLHLTPRQVDYTIWEWGRSRQRLSQH